MTATEEDIKKLYLRRKYTGFDPDEGHELKQISLRLPMYILEWAEALRPDFHKYKTQEVAMWAGKMTTAAVLKYCLIEGIDKVTHQFIEEAYARGETDNMEDVLQEELEKLERKDDS
jgi:hypothetical protein